MRGRVTQSCAHTRERERERNERERERERERVCVAPNLVRVGLTRDNVNNSLRHTLTESVTHSLVCVCTRSLSRSVALSLSRIFFSLSLFCSVFRFLPHARLYFPPPLSANLFRTRILSRRPSISSYLPNGSTSRSDGLHLAPITASRHKPPSRPIFSEPSHRKRVIILIICE